MSTSTTSAGTARLLLGHCAPEVVAAVQRQVTLGTHFGSAHELELRWAELIKTLVPGAERVRFTSSGTEATHLALRLARAFTGKDKVVRFLGHFHGWHDHVAAGSNSHYDGTRPIGVLPDIVEATILMPTDDVQRTVSLLDSRDDIAAVIVEPSGASWGQVPLPPGFLQALREATARRRVDPDLRRGHQRIPLQPRRRPAGLRDHRRPVHDGQDRRRRLARRRARRAARHHGRARLRRDQGRGA